MPVLFFYCILQLFSYNYLGYAVIYVNVVFVFIIAYYFIICMTVESSYTVIKQTAIINVCLQCFFSNYQYYIDIVFMSLKGRLGVFKIFVPLVRSQKIDLNMLLLPAVPVD